jgi:phage/plasmid-associated DNA primase
LVLLPFKNEIKEYDTRLLDKIIGEYPHGKESSGSENKQFDERPGLIALALKGWDLFRDNGFIIKAPDWVNESKKTWTKEANSTLKFLDEYFVEGKNFGMIERGELYDKYKSWCNSEGRKELGKKNFLEEVRKENMLKETRRNSAWFMQYTAIDGTVNNDMFPITGNPDDEPF